VCTPYHPISHPLLCASSRSRHQASVGSLLACTTGVVIFDRGLAIAGFSSFLPPSDPPALLLAFSETDVNFPDPFPCPSGLPIPSPLAPPISIAVSPFGSFHSQLPTCTSVQRVDRHITRPLPRTRALCTPHTFPPTSPVGICKMTAHPFLFVFSVDTPFPSLATTLASLSRQSRLSLAPPSGFISVFPSSLAIFSREFLPFLSFASSLSQQASPAPRSLLTRLVGNSPTFSLAPPTRSKTTACFDRTLAIPPPAHRTLSPAHRLRGVHRPPHARDPFAPIARRPLSAGALTAPI